MFTVTASVHHGDYRAAFTGSGKTVGVAFTNAALQSSYAVGIVPGTGSFESFREHRMPMYLALIAALEAGESYAGFGWVTFTIESEPTKQARNLQAGDVVSFHEGSAPETVVSVRRIHDEGPTYYVTTVYPETGSRTGRTVRGTQHVTVVA